MLLGIWPMAAIYSSSKKLKSKFRKGGRMSFRTISPQNEQEALAVLNSQNEGVLPIAGGTNLLVDIKQHKVAPKTLLDLSRIKEWKKIEPTEGGVAIGPLVTHSELEASPLLKESFAALAMAASNVGSPQIRNRGTLGGNLQSASPAADCVPALLVFDAVLTLVSFSGRRQVRGEDFILGPGKTVLRSDELIGRIDLKKLPNRISSFRKIGLRKSLAISLVNLAIGLELEEDNRCTTARISFGSVAPTPIRAKRLEAFLEDKIIDLKIMDELLKRVDEDIAPIDDIRASAAYRKHLARELLKQSFHNLIGYKEELTWLKPH